MFFKFAVIFSPQDFQVKFISTQTMPSLPMSFKPPLRRFYLFDVRTTIGYPLHCIPVRQMNYQNQQRAVPLLHDLQQFVAPNQRRNESRDHHHGSDPLKWKIWLHSLLLVGQANFLSCRYWNVVVSCQNKRDVLNSAQYTTKHDVHRAVIITQSCPNRIASQISKTAVR